MQFSNRFSGLFTSLLDVLLPGTCLACDESVNSGRFLCEKCTLGMITVDETLRLREYNRKFTSSKSVSDFFPLYLFENHSPVQKLVHSIKYDGKYLAARAMGRLLGERLKSTGFFDKDWCLIPVPLHKIRYFERGYNQSEFLAEGIGDVLNTSLDIHVLCRRRNTQSQTKLTFDERLINVRDAFSIRHPERIQGKNLLLVDDVITTGATVNECARVLKASGAASVFAASLALAE